MKQDARFARAIDLVTVRTAATYIGISYRWLNVLIARGDVDWYDVGGRRMIHMRDIQALMARRRSNEQVS